eukprot:scaffold410_cov125-Isochrysis_galbana.AAC.11
MSYKSMDMEEQAFTPRRRGRDILNKFTPPPRLCMPRRDDHRLHWRMATRTGSAGKNVDPCDAGATRTRQIKIKHEK